MNLLAVVVAVLAGFEVGADGRLANGSNPMPFVMAVVAILLVAAIMRHSFAVAGIEGVGKSLLSGLGVGAFFVAPSLAKDYAYSMRDRRLTWINGGYAILGCGAIGLVLGLF
jgi:hypothetical protein